MEFIKYQQLAQRTEKPLDRDAALRNIDKLKTRYPEKYSNAAALARADKATTP